MIENKKLEKEKNFVSIVVYVKNAENEIEKFVKKIDSFFETKFLYYEFVFVNDNSYDKTKEKLTEISETLTGNVVVIDLAYEHGIELAMLSGIDFSIGDFVFEFDTLNINYDLNEIINIYNKSIEGYDIVSASSNIKEKKSSKVFYKFLSKVSQPKMNLTTEEFRVISRRAINRFLKNKEKFRYRKALYHYSGLNTFIYKYQPINNLLEDKKMSLKQKINLAFEILMNFSDIGLILITYIFLLFFFTTIISLGMIVYFSIYLKESLNFFLLNIFVILSSFTFLFFMLMILMKYLIVILLEVKNRPSYTYKSVERLSRR